MARLGIIGAGAFARYTLAAYRAHIPDLEFVAIASRTRSRAEAVAAEFGIAGVESDNQSLFSREDLDIIAILTPPQTHYMLAKAALEQGKHVMVDKPVAFTAKQALELVELAWERGLQLTTNLVLHVHPLNRRVRQLTEDGELGSLRQIITTALLARYPEDHWYWQPEISGGFFLNTFAHFLDLFDFVAGEEATDLCSAGNAENGYTLLATYPSGVHAAFCAGLQVSNANEIVRSTYVFEHGIVESRGWLPESLTIRAEGEAPVTVQGGPKEAEYRACLAAIMADLLKRIAAPHTVSELGIDLHVVCNSVRTPVRCEESRFGNRG